MSYTPDQIRTSNMTPDRSTDVYFEPDSSLTQQQFQKECDINYIVKQNEKTGLITHVNQKTPQYGDFTASIDYQEALNYVQTANDSFMALPADLRARFSNNPAKFVAFCSDPANASELVSLGLANKPDETPTPDQQPVVTPASAV